MAIAPARSLFQSLAPEGAAARYATFGALAIVGSLLIALAGKVTVPFWPVPATLQTLAIFVIAAAFGRKLALATLAAYLIEGAAGLPVFTNGGGLAYFAGPTTGYLAGFVVAAGLTGWAADRGLDRNAFKLFAVNLVGTAIILLLGAAWIALAFGPEKALAWGVGPFIATDVIKAALAAAVVPAGWQIATLFRR
ncbi:biotin transporter BioY [Hoeflea sp. YIM 152468]|uniref:biotin transporter BioY n=1 Tax=Hoeflea sp. YIM 152468 TaxID=3031759 RepID=UPI0023D97AAB|nr:biotin transporter BioY [Hoeflea sp. YIM 152468]MDF1608538.1 biotin transporter BioY [Hoeflea sp. YIM 152468]